jgi:hypothetical protein
MMQREAAPVQQMTQLHLLANIAEVLRSQTAAAQLGIAAPQPVLWTRSRLALDKWHQPQQRLQQQTAAVVSAGVHLLCLA